MRLKLAHRMSLFIGCALLLGIGAISYEAIYSNTLIMKEIGKNESERLSRMIFDELYATMQSGGDRAENRAILERLRKIEGIEELRFIHSAQIDRQYGIEADETPIDEHDRAALKGETVSFIEENGFRNARFVLPIFITRECMSCHIGEAGDVNGAISVRISLKKYESLFSQHTRHTSYIGGGGLLAVFLAIFILIRRRVLVPIASIDKGAKALASGELEHRLQINTGDELEDVGKSFDRMAASLQAKTEELNALLARHAKLMEMAADAVMLRGFETGSIIEVNPQLETLTGYSKDTLLQMSAENLHPKARLMEYRKACEEWKQTGKGYLHNTLIRRKDGSTIPVEIAASVIKSDGKVFIQEVWRDLTKREGFDATIKRYAEELENLVAERTKSLKESEEKFRTLVETANDAIFIADAETGTIIKTNKSAEALLGLPAEQIVGMNQAQLHPADEAERYHEIFEGHVRSGKAMTSDLYVCHKDGRKIPVDISASVVELGGHKLIQGIFHDTSARKQTEEALEKSSEQLRASLIGTILAVSRAVGARDPYTAGHQQRVSQLSRAIAQEMGLDSERIDGLRLGASIHDIGKIYLPAEILSKPTKLSVLEYEMIKTHSQVGYDILKDIAFPWPVADIAHQHHEHLDGSGYPQGLKGDEICLEARIVAVADVFEAMVSHRPYRPGLSIEVTLEELESKRGKWFDADVVDTCLKLFSENRFSFEGDKHPLDC
jgi:PAS domain S-box-containing protein/putative nucleotidyltransferase with HDIG domain